MTKISRRAFLSVLALSGLLLCKRSYAVAIVNIHRKISQISLRDFVRLKYKVNADYQNARVVIHKGWVISKHEFDIINSEGDFYSFQTTNEN